MTEKEWQAAEEEKLMQILAEHDPKKLHHIGFCGGIKAAATHLREMSEVVCDHPEASEETKAGAKSALDFAADLLDSYTEISTELLLGKKKRT